MFTNSSSVPVRHVLHALQVLHAQTSIRNSFFIKTGAIKIDSIFKISGLHFFLNSCPLDYLRRAQKLKKQKHIQSRSTPRTRENRSANRARAHQEEEHTGAQAENKSTVRSGAHQEKKSIQEHSQSSSTYRESRTTSRAGERAYRIWKTHTMAQHEHKYTQS
jgi:hypothetical protein